jgi:septum formation protein
MVILASSSPRRKELLAQLKLPFKIVPSDVAELVNENLTAGELCQVNAYRKARAVSKKFPDAVVIGVDTLVSLGRKVYGKPASKSDARRMLAELQGHTHQVLSGVCLIHLREHRQKVFADQTHVTFRSLSPTDITKYHKKVDPLDKAGAYAIQQQGDDLVEKISGSFTNVVGLPLERLQAELVNFQQR